MWYAPVTSCVWFNQYGHAKQSSAEKVNSSLLPIANEHIQESVYTQEPERKASAARRDRSTRSYTRNYIHPAPAKQYTTNMSRYVRGGSGSPPHSGSSIADIERGGMLNPKSTRRS